MTTLELLTEWQRREPELLERADEREAVFNLDGEQVTVSTDDEQDIFNVVVEVLTLKGDYFRIKNSKVGGLRRAHVVRCGIGGSEFVGLGKTDTAALLKAYVRYIAVAKEA